MNMVVFLSIDVINVYSTAEALCQLIYSISQFPENCYIVSVMSQGHFPQIHWFQHLKSETFAAHLFYIAVN